MNSVNDIKDSIIDGIKDRTSNPFLFTFSWLFIAVNWRPISLLLFDTGHTLQYKIKNFPFSGAPYHYELDYIFPLLVAPALVILSPALNNLSSMAKLWAEDRLTKYKAKKYANSYIAIDELVDVKSKNESLRNDLLKSQKDVYNLSQSEATLNKQYNAASDEVITEKAKVNTLQDKNKKLSERVLHANNDLNSLALLLSNINGYINTLHQNIGIYEGGPTRNTRELLDVADEIRAYTNNSGETKIFSKTGKEWFDTTESELVAIIEENKDVFIEARKIVDSKRSEQQYDDYEKADMMRSAAIAQAMDEEDGEREKAMQQVSRDELLEETTSKRTLSETTENVLLNTVNRVLIAEDIDANKISYSQQQLLRMVKAEIKLNNPDVLLTELSLNVMSEKVREALYALGFDSVKYKLSPQQIEAEASSKRIRERKIADVMSRKSKDGDSN